MLDKSGVDCQPTDNFLTMSALDLDTYKTYKKFMSGTMVEQLGDFVNFKDTIQDKII